ncbi:hypothetical protein HU200_058263 [Digitaria exilis]|uniref:DUF4220 domain-containing protein n=1 Tax=Digitaria exilis TaxID=1010633 RepID=A0A835E283_9POAL|nr:hypothetical protein HU200_058263 [Digitaria exilis]
MADSIAIYAIGHLAVTSQAAEHQVMALWAPLLLVHLGGQDNITAYAIEDNRLWLRHLQTLVVQAVGAAYVLYVSLQVEPAAGGDGRRSSSQRHPWLRHAAVLLFLVGVGKYGERVWAMFLADHSTYASYKYTQAKSAIRYTSVTEIPKTELSERDTEGMWKVAICLLDFAKDVLMGPRLWLNLVEPYKLPIRGDVMRKVAEMQLSLMHDVFYTKVEMIHTHPFFLCIRVFYLVATPVALSLFHLHQAAADQQGTSRRDAVVTYVLLAGAVVLEVVSLLTRALSIWTWRPLAFQSRQVVWTRFVPMCSAAAASRFSSLAYFVGHEDWWNTFINSCSTRVSPLIKDLLVRQVLKSVGISKDSPSHISNSRGRAALERWGWAHHAGPSPYPDEEDKVVLESVVSLEFGESILVWHCASDAYLHWYRSEQLKTQGHRLRQEDAAAAAAAAAAAEMDNLARAVQALSNYMFFLLAARPYMLPPASRARYGELCSDLIRYPEHYSGCSELLCAHAMNPPIRTSVSLALPLQFRPPADGTDRISNWTMKKAYDLCECLINRDRELQDAPAAAG